MAYPPPCRILVMASGEGTNFQALIEAVRVPESGTPKIPNSRIIRLIVNRKGAGARTRAEKEGIPCEYFNIVDRGYVAKGETDEKKREEARKKYDAALAELVLGPRGNEGENPERGAAERPELVVLAGWMHVFNTSFLQPLREAGVKIINLHPALPKQYDGKDAIERAFADYQAGKRGLTHTGIMVHHVVEEVDRGETIAVKEIPFAQGESIEDLKKRIHAEEHKLIVDATARVVKDILEARA